MGADMGVNCPLPRCRAGQVWSAKSLPQNSGRYGPRVNWRRNCATTPRTNCVPATSHVPAAELFHHSSSSLPDLATDPCAGALVLPLGPWGPVIFPFTICRGRRRRNLVQRGRGLPPVNRGPTNPTAGASVKVTRGPGA